MSKTDKIYILTSCIYCGFIAFAIYCLYFAVSTLTDNDLREKEAQARKKIDREENFRRGDILSCDGQAIAVYFPEYILYTDFNIGVKSGRTINTRRVSPDGNPVQLDTFRISLYRDLSESLSKTLGGSAAGYYRGLYDSRIKAENKNGGTKNILKDKIDIFQRTAIFSSPYLKEWGKNKTGIYTREAGERRYLFGKNFAHSAVGSVNENSGDSKVSGIEYLYDRELKNGDNIVTTIDTRMQDICEAVLQNKISEDKRLIGGTIVVMDVATGDIKAIANSGMYSDENFSDTRDIYNNAMKATIEPGSTFKTVSLMLALETGKISLSEKFNSKIWRESKTWSEENRFDSLLSVSRIIEQSSNTGTGNMVDKAFSRNVNKFIEAIKKLGITGDTLSYINTKLGRESMLRISHGYQIKLAPIHILTFYNAIANSGVMLRPRLVRGLIRHNTEKIEVFDPEIINGSICSKTTLDTVRMVLSRVVGQGSAQQIAGRPYGIAGKTGTALMNLTGGKYERNELSRELSSFCGYFPEKKPKYSCIVTLYSRFLSKKERESFSASSTAVPVFGKIADKIYALYLEKNFMPDGNTLNIPAVKNARGENLSAISRKLGLDIPVDSEGWLKVEEVNSKLQTSEIPVKNGIMPDVTGMGLRDAVFLLENKGLRVSYSGTGAVIKQSPEKGVPYNPSQRIYLELGDENK
ncbi:MAG: PASTA domain-containing protein [Prevotellaceae bacterium]|jgi:cell division protein FtsI (penicillin-binding protein 3)|nr:PASTA domain-containing protein [Prevotellaceae bacterium]